MWYSKLSLIMLFILSFWLTSAVESTAQPEGKNELRQFTSEELQAAVMSFADTLASQLGEAIDDFAEQAATPEARHHADRFRFYSLAAAFEIGAGKYPGAALLDMLVLVTLSRIVWEEYWYPEVYGQSAEGIVEVLKELETVIWSIAANVLTSQQRQELRDLIGQWRKEHPDKVGVAFIRFSDFEGLGRKPSLEKAREAGGFLAPVKEAAEAADEIRAMGDRAMYLVVRMQELLNLRAKMTIQDLLTTPEITKLLSDITAFRDLAERYAELVEGLPAQISDQANATIDQAMARATLQSEEIVDHFVQQFGRERRAALEQAFQGIAQERKATLEQIIQDLEEQRTVAIRQVLEGVAEERQAITRNLVQLADRGEREAEEWITHIFVLGAAIVFVFFLLRLAYRYAAEQSARARPGRLAASVGLGVVALIVVLAALTYVNRGLHKSAATFDAGQNNQDDDTLLSLERPSQPSATIYVQRTPSSDQELSLAPDTTSDTWETTPVVPEAGNALEAGKPTPRQETVTNEDMSAAPEKEASAQTPTSKDLAQSTSEYKQIIPKHILFDSGGWQLKQETFETLDEVVAHLQQNVSLRLIIQGHSDSRGSEDLNQKLSEKRAEAVAAYLVQSGVSSDRLKTVGYGSSQPIATNETPKGRAQNRRVVIETILQSKPYTNSRK